jgi:anti-sigma B factor antagonist
MEQQLDVVVSAVGGAAFIRPEGVLDIKGADGFESEVRSAIRREPAEILVDLRGVTFLDSIGLRSLFRTCQWCDREHMALSVVTGGEPVRRILRVTGADMLLPLVEDTPLRLRGVC